MGGGSTRFHTSIFITKERLKTIEEIGFHKFPEGGGHRFVTLFLVASLKHYLHIMKRTGKNWRSEH